MTEYLIKVKGTTPLLSHRFIGKDENKRVMRLPEVEQASEYAYRVDPDNDKSNLAALGYWFRGALVESFLSSAGSKSVRKTKEEVGPRLWVKPDLIDLGTKTFNINRKIIPIKRAGMIADMADVIRPEIKDWGCEFTLVSELARTDKEIEAEVIRSGKNQGVGSGRAIGYGRFEVVSFKKTSP